MMNRMFLHSIQATLLALVMTTGPSYAQTKGPTEHYWYDGDVKRPLWIDGSRVADFSSQERSHAAVVKAMPATKSMSEGMSPLFRDNADDSARTRALPGGVVVRLRQVLPDDQARAFLQQRGLKAVREGGQQTGVWLVESAPGTATLELANRLHEGREFVSASPNWWQPRTLK